MTGCSSPRLPSLPPGGPPAARVAVTISSRTARCCGHLLAQVGRPKHWQQGRPVRPLPSRAGCPPAGVVHLRGRRLLQRWAGASSPGRRLGSCILLAHNRWAWQTAHRLAQTLRTTLHLETTMPRGRGRMGVHRLLSPCGESPRLYLRSATRRTCGRRRVVPGHVSPLVPTIRPLLSRTRTLPEINPPPLPPVTFLVNGSIATVSRG